MMIKRWMTYSYRSLWWSGCIGLRWAVFSNSGVFFAISRKLPTSAVTTLHHKLKFQNDQSWISLILNYNKGLWAVLRHQYCIVEVDTLMLTFIQQGLDFWWAHVNLRSGFVVSCQSCCVYHSAWTFQLGFTNLSVRQAFTCLVFVVVDICLSWWPSLGGPPKTYIFLLNVNWQAEAVVIIMCLIKGWWKGHTIRNTLTVLASIVRWTCFIKDAYDV